LEVTRLAIDARSRAENAVGINAGSIDVGIQMSVEEKPDGQRDRILLAKCDVGRRDGDEENEGVRSHT